MTLFSLQKIIFLIFTLCWSHQSYGGSQKLPLPRFASLRSSRVNVHVGPAIHSPVEWTLQSPGLPVEIIAEFDTWRQIKDKEGTTGWVHKSLLSGKRTALLAPLGNKGEDPPKSALRKKASPDAPIIAYIESGVIIELKECHQTGWCRIKVKPYEGWVERSTLWGLYENEVKF